MAPAAAPDNYRICRPLLLLLLLSLVLNIPEVSGWSASSVFDIAADLLEPGDDSGLQSRHKDPLLESIRQHEAASDARNQKKNMDQTPNFDPNERFLVPMLSAAVGDNNQLMEYMGATLVARATNRTLCLTPFFSGPSRHTTQLARSSLNMEERYNVESLHKFVKVSSLQNCFKECNHHIDGFWRLRTSPALLGSGWTWDDKTVKQHDLGWSYVNWTSINHVKQAFESFDDERCVAMGGLFPGFRWRGAYLAPSLFIRPSSSILNIVDALQNLTMTTDGNYLAVHWRFEESLCKQHGLGLCFPRCSDGSIIDSGLRPTLDVKRQFSCRHGNRGVVVTKEDIVTAIYNKAKKENVQIVYLATDGWIRGPGGKVLIKEVVEDLRNRGMTVVGLWKIDGLSNLSNGGNDDLMDMVTLYINKNNKKMILSGHTISEVEQEVCVRARAFMGSGQSTWTLTVFRERLAARRKQQLRQAFHNNITSTNTSTTLMQQQIDDLVVESILSDPHEAGMQCMYSYFFNRARLKTRAPQETYQDEAPDSWLDVDACEGLLQDGIGTCKPDVCLIR